MQGREGINCQLSNVGTIFIITALLTRGHLNKCQFGHVLCGPALILIFMLWDGNEDSIGLHRE